MNDQQIEQLTAKIKALPPHVKDGDAYLELLGDEPNPDLVLHIFACWRQKHFRPIVAALDALDPAKLSKLNKNAIAKLVIPDYVAFHEFRDLFQKVRAGMPKQCPECHQELKGVPAGAPPFNATELQLQRGEADGKPKVAIEVPADGVARTHKLGEPAPNDAPK